MYHVVAAIMCIVAVAWIFLFPLVCISSGEPKPRGFFVDEHALMTRSELPVRDFNYSLNFFMNISVLPKGVEGYCAFKLREKNNTETTRQNEMKSDMENKCSLTGPRLRTLMKIRRYHAICEAMRTMGASCGVLSQSNSRDERSALVYHLHSDEDERREPVAYQIDVRPSGFQQPTEAIVVVVLFNEDRDRDDCTPFVPLHLGVQLVRNLLLSQWLAKRITILYVPTSRINTAVYSNTVSQWLAAQHTTAGVGSSVPHVGLIREAFAVDLTTDTTAIKDRRCYEDGVPPSTSSDSSLFEWDTLSLGTVGLNGVQPNLDVVTAVSDMLPWATVTESDPRNFDNWLEGTGKRRSTIGFLTSLVLPKEPSNPNPQHPRSNPVLSYTSRLKGLLAFFGSVLTGPHGVHAQFLRHDVDSITIRPWKKNKSKNNSSKGKDPGHSNDLKALSGLLFRVLYLFSNLHEELHHSQFFYLLVGGRSFVGIQEYGITALLWLAALLLLFVSLSFHNGTGKEPSPTTPEKELEYAVKAEESETEEGKTRIKREAASLWTRFGFHDDEVDGPSSGYRDKQLLNAHNIAYCIMSLLSQNFFQVGMLYVCGNCSLSEWFELIAPSVKVTTRAWLWALALIHMVGNWSLYAFAVNRATNEEARYQEVDVLGFYLLLLVVLMFAGLALLLASNFTLGALVSVVVVPSMVVLGYAFSLIQWHTGLPSRPPAYYPVVRAAVLLVFQVISPLGFLLVDSFVFGAEEDTSVILYLLKKWEKEGSYTFPALLFACTSIANAGMVMLSATTRNATFEARRWSK